MAISVFFTFLLLSFGLIAFQDFQSRSFEAWLIPASLVSIFGLSVSSTELSIVLQHSGMNLLILFIIGISVYAYAIIRNKSLRSPVDELIGLGDILFLVVLSFGFNIINFLIFIAFTSAIGIVIGSVSYLIRPERTPRIPYAAYLAIFYLLLVMIMEGDGNSFLFYADLLGSLKWIY
jgi:hypothetical protein